MVSFVQVVLQSWVHSKVTFEFGITNTISKVLKLWCSLMRTKFSFKSHVVLLKERKNSQKKEKKEVTIDYKERSKIKKDDQGKKKQRFEGQRV